MTLLDLVARERARLSQTALALRGFAVAAVAAAGLAGGALLLGRARWLELPAPLPALWWLVVVAAAAAVAWAVGRRLAPRVAPEAVARAIEHEQALRDGQLRAVLEVAGSGTVLATHAADRLGARLAQVAGALAPAHAAQLRRRMAAGGGACAVALLVAVATAGSHRDGWAALARPLDAWRGTLLAPPAFADRPSLVRRGDSLQLVAVAPARRTLSLTWRAVGAPERTVRAARGPGDRFVFSLGAVDADLVAVLSDGRARSDTLAVRVVDRPFVGDVTIEARFPAYLDRAPERFPADDPLRVPEGTELTIAARASSGVAAVALVAADSVPLDLVGQRVTGRLTARSSGAWRWSATGDRGQAPDLPGALILDVIPDRAPEVRIVEPARDTLVAPDDRVLVIVEAADDIGLTEVAMRAWTERADGARAGGDPVVLAAGRGLAWQGEFTLDLSALRLGEGDAVRLQAGARDAARREAVQSRDVLLRVPTMTERRAAARDLGDSAVASATAAAAAQKALQRETQDAARQRDRRAAATQPAGDGGAPASYEQQERARRIAQAQREQVADARAVAEQAQQLARRLAQAQAMDSALARRLAEVQRLLHEAITPELLATLRQLEQGRQGQTGDDLQRSLADLAEQQDKLRQALERSAEMLRRAALEGAMETLKDEARDVAAAQRALAEALAGTPPPDEGTTAARLEERSRALERAAQDLARRLQEAKAEPGAARAAEAADQAGRSADAMAQAQRRQHQGAAQQQDRQGQPPQGREGQSPGEGGAAARQAATARAADAMAEAADRLAEARAQQVQQWKRELTDELDKAVQEMVQMAREQEQLAQQARQADGQQAGQLRAQQGALQQGVGNTQERVEQASRRSALLSPRAQQAMADARRRVERATREAQESGQQPQQAADEMEAAADALRQAAAALARDRERAAEARSASGLDELLKQMQEAGQAQGALSGLTQSLLPQRGQGPDQQALQAAAQRQRDIARRLEDAADADASGRAELMAREARQLAQALERGVLDQSVVDRQQRLFRRLLDAGRTLEQEQRDETGKREAEAPKSTAVYRPGDVARGPAAVRYAPPTWEELRGLSAEERRLVIDYFRRLNATPPPR